MDSRYPRTDPSANPAAARTNPYAREELQPDAHASTVPASVLPRVSVVGRWGGRQQLDYGLKLLQRSREVVDVCACWICNGIKADFTLDRIGWELQPIPDSNWLGLTERYRDLWELAGQPDAAYHGAWLRLLSA